MGPSGADVKAVFSWKLGFFFSAPRCSPGALLPEELQRSTSPGSLPAQGKPFRARLPPESIAILLQLVGNKKYEAVWVFSPLLSWVVVLPRVSAFSGMQFSALARALSPATAMLGSFCGDPVPDSDLALPERELLLLALGCIFRAFCCFFGAFFVVLFYYFFFRCYFSSLVRGADNFAGSTRCGASEDEQKAVTFINFATLAPYLIPGRQHVQPSWL